MKKQSWVMIIFGLCTVICLPAYAGATDEPPPPPTPQLPSETPLPSKPLPPGCNNNLDQTGAEFVTVNNSCAFSTSCEGIVGSFGKMHSVSARESCGVNGCEVETTDASKPFDAVFIGTNDQCCVYIFKDALEAKSLTGPQTQFRFACSDGGITKTDLPVEPITSLSDEPITSLEGGCSADADLAGIQAAVEGQDSIGWVFAVGNTDDENDKTGLCVQGGFDDLARCDEQCIVPVDSPEFPYNPGADVCATGEILSDGDPTTVDPTVFPLSCRPCALTQEAAPPDGSKSYCWERSHQRAFIDEQAGGGIGFNDFFIPIRTKSTGNLSYSSFEGSTCYQVSTSYRGRVYTYWTPSGCP